jgi:mRNA interferase MazF
MTTKPGEMYIVDLGISGKLRPMVVVSREDFDPPRALTICAPVTTAYRASKYEVDIGKPRFMRMHSYVNVQGLQAIQNHELGKRIGMLDDKAIAKICVALKYAFNL